MFASRLSARLRRLRDVRKEVGELIIARLGKLPPTARLPLESGQEALIVHGSPLDPTEPMCADMDDSELQALLGDDPAAQQHLTDLTNSPLVGPLLWHTFYDYNVIGFAVVSELFQASRTASFTVTPSHPSQNAVSVNFATRPRTIGSPSAATPPPRATRRSSSTSPAQRRRG